MTEQLTAEERAWLHYAAEAIRFGVPEEDVDTYADWCMVTLEAQARVLVYARDDLRAVLWTRWPLRLLRRSRRWC